MHEMSTPSPPSPHVPHLEIGSPVSPAASRQDSNCIRRLGVHLQAILAMPFKTNALGGGCLLISCTVEPYDDNARYSRGPVPFCGTVPFFAARNVSMN